ncbi:uncharacterized protein F4822DRAFT_302175 [Hypoxylon trugodes]|uniref:uncharacterized protein n=1 Tax=Hypoxylon trugodes TaxID=326681 RepID=UPI00219E18CA|nr:uncharacterized protein F4822DRAFT_302175 [Hypoxylon trugodes]KAI1388097.1 hypothetical protein F4822DRAFT_302175 [Hypoxylon trugodes]
MAYERYLARMTLRGPDADDTFPERHAVDSPPGLREHPDPHDEDSETVARPIRRRRRRRSESTEGYEMRDRYWEAMDIIDRDLKEAAKAPAVWDYVYDPVCLPPPKAEKTPAIRRLGNLPIKRAWRRRNSREGPDLTSTSTIEAIMLYERGMMIPRQSQCTHCQQGRGISPGCVIMELDGEVQEGTTDTGGLGSSCSNCLYDGRPDQCDARAPSPSSSQPSRTQTPSQIKRSFASNPTHLEVLDMVDKTIKSKKGDGKDDVIVRAKQIETAALEIAQAAHEWGLAVMDKRRKNVDPKDRAN